MRQSRLSNLALLSIESDMVKDNDFDDEIETKYQSFFNSTLDAAAILKERLHRWAEEIVRKNLIHQVSGVK